MRTASQLNKQFRDLWTVNDLCVVLSVTPMTVHAWRKNKDLPTVILPGNMRDTIRFVPEEIETWAQKNGVSFKRKVKRLRLVEGAAA
jgi:hypothetical protein